MKRYYYHSSIDIRRLLDRTKELFFHPTAYFGVLCKRIFERKREFVPFMPRAVYVDVSGVCNLRCEMCLIRLLPRRQSIFMSFDRFRRVIEQFQPYQTRRFVIGGIGEPLLNPDLIKMLKYAKERGFQTEMFTNGTLIDKHNVKDLVTNLDCVHFSIDGGRKETYEAIRKGANFDKVVNNISLFTKVEKNVGSRVHTWINFVVMSLNYREVVDVVSLAHRLGINNVTAMMIRIPSRVEDIPSYSERIDNLRLKYRQISHLIEEAYTLSKRHGMGFWFEPSTHYAPTCTWPWWGCFVTRDGFVAPCCECIDPSVINFGNLFLTPFSEIWNNTMFRGFRRRLMSASAPRICRECGL